MKFECIIKDWQLHHLHFKKSALKKLYPYRKVKSLIVSGTVVLDLKGRWPKGHHMRSSLITKVDRKNKRIYTLNTIYKIIGKEGNDILPDLGNGILKIFY